MDFTYSLAGFFVGAVVGLTGVGGGSLMTPLLVLLFGIHPATAVGTDLLYAAITKSGGSATADVITDFGNRKGNNDHFEIDNSVWSGVKDGWLKAGQFGLVSGKPGKAQMDADDRILYDKAKGDVWYDRDGSGTEHGAIKLAEVDDGTILSHKDFLII